MNDVETVRRIDKLARDVDSLRLMEFTRAVKQDTPLTSTSWDGDARSTIGKTLIDLSAVFGVPAGVSWILADVALRDSGSSGAADCAFCLWSTNVDWTGTIWRCSGLANDAIASGTFWIPCNSDGDVYYQCSASVAGALDVWLRINGWAF